MVGQNSGTLTLTLKKQAEHYTIEASGPKGIRVEPRPAPQLKTLLSDPQITDTLRELSGRTAPATTETIQQLGKALYDALFTHPELLLAFGKAQGSASSDSGVRLRLQIEPTELAALPWETLHDGKEWLSTQSSTPLVRKLALSENRKPLQKLQIRGALRILFVGASPEDLDRLEVKQTAEELEILLGGAIKKKQIVFDKLLNATLEDLQQGLLKDYHILYFAGHGSPEGIFLDDGEGDDIEKAGKVVRGRGDKMLVSAETLAQALEGKQTRLVFLAACETSKASERSRLLRGFAQELVERSNLPAIVAMQYFISDMQANPLTTQFFAALAAGRPVDVAMAEARAVLMSQGQVNRDVFSPVLYLQAEDGALFPKTKNWPAISLGVALLIAAVIGGGFARSAEMEQIQTSVALSAAKLSNNQELEATIASIRAGKAVQQSLWQKVIPNAQMQLSALGQLQQMANTGQEQNRLEGHQGSVTSVVFSPDGKQLATSGEDGTARLWDINGKQLVALRGHQGSVTSVVFSPDGKQLVTSGVDGTTRVWDTSGKQLALLKSGRANNVVFSPDGKQLVTRSEGAYPQLWDTRGKELARLRSGEATSVVFSPDGKQLATGGADGITRLWDTNGNLLSVLKGEVSDTTQWDDRGREMIDLKGPRGSINNVVFSPDGKQLVTRGEDGSTRLWDTKGKQLVVFGGGRGGVTSVAFSSDGKQLATGGEDGTARLWKASFFRGDYAALQEPTTLEGHQGNVSVVFSPDGKQLATGGEDGTVRLWDPDGKQLAVLAGHQGNVNSVVFSPDGKHLATSGVDGTARLWNTNSKQLAVLTGHQGRVTSVVFSTDRKQLATSGADGTARLWDTNGKQLATIEDDQGRVTSVVFSTDRKQLATSGADGTARLWDTNGKQLAVLTGHQGHVWSVVFSTDGQQLATSGVDGTARLWDTNGKQLAVLTGHQGSVNSVVFSPDGKQLATSGVDGTARLWDTNGKQLAALKGHQGLVTSVVFSSDGKQLATRGADGTARLWDTNGKQLAVLAGHQGSVNSVVFSSDGKQLATSGADGTARLWDTNGKQLAVLAGHQGSVNSVVFSPDGKQLATSGDDGTARLWDTNGRQLAALKGHRGLVTSVVFSSDGKQLATSGADGTARLWQVGGIDELLSSNCDWVRDYLENSPSVMKQDRHLCDGIGSRN
jgi:WD40 repeat protein/CHAT domain-containing protein